MKEYNDQEFLYRQTPVNYDGIAKFTSIKGNTLAWNQLVPSLSAMQGQNGTLSVADNVATITSSSSATYLGIAVSGSSIVLPKGGHKYLLTAEVNSSKAMSSCSMVYGNNISVIKYNVSANTWTKVSTMASYGSPTGQYIQLRAYGSFEQGDTMQVRNWNYFDLTAMGLDSLTVEQFTSLFPLPFYDFNQGTLIPFSGNGIKTVGFNQWDEEWEVGGINTSGNNTSTAGYYRSKNYIPVFPLTSYYYKFPCTMQVFFYDANKNFISRIGAWNDSYLTPSNARYIRFRNGNPNEWLPYNNDICINISGDKNGTYEPYTTTTTDLPISTYFPTGMKRAGNVYDELTESKAITRVGSRAYQSGDENNTNYVTDGTTTYYPLATPTETDAEDIFYKFYGNGTEQILPVNGTTPTTAPIWCDIEYYNQIEGETPYRKFWLVNGDGERWDLTEKELKSFLENPQGLGFQKTIDVTRYGERAYKNTESYNFPQVTGDVLFYDSANSTRYEKYNEFVRFLMEQPITLHYMIPVSYNSLIADTYSLECEVMSLTKTESKTDRILTSNIQMNGLGFYEGDEIEINGTANTLTINNKGDFPVGFEIELRGTYKNPYFTLEQNGELYGEAKFDDNANNFSSVFVNSKDGEQNVVLKQNNSIMPNPLAYQDLSISNGSIYVTFVKLAKGESTLTIGADSYTISGYTIRYTPIYRSV